MITSAATEKIAADWDLWREYVDTDAVMTRQEFDLMTVEQRIALIKQVFGGD